MKRYKIGDLCFCWESEEYILQTGEYSEKFKIEDGNGMEEIHFRACITDLDSYNEYKRIFENYSYEIVQVEDEQMIIYHWAHRKLAFAIWPDRINVDGDNICYIDFRLMDEINMVDDWFFGLIGLHKAFLQKGAPIFHASYIDYKGQAILFAAPSGTGKSTQASLWETFAGAEIINGDRVLMRKRGDSWYAFGYPSCGSSDICIDRTLPIGAIVVLKQGIDNEIRKLSAAEGVRALASGIEVYNWDADEIEVAVNLAQDIVFKVPVIELTCRPDKDAVELLKVYLQEKLWHQ